MVVWLKMISGGWASFRRNFYLLRPKLVHEELRLKEILQKYV